VVVLQHGSGGMGANIEMWSRELSAIGVSTLALDGFICCNAAAADEWFAHCATSKASRPSAGAGSIPWRAATAMFAR
jgi:hypothetical protein